jgi:hypothetical protein
MQEFIFGFLFYSSAFMLAPHCSDCSFVIDFEIRRLEPSKLFFHFQNCFGYSESLDVFLYVIPTI